MQCLFPSNLFFGIRMMFYWNITIFKGLNCNQVDNHNGSWALSKKKFLSIFRSSNYLFCYIICSQVCILQHFNLHKVILLIVILNFINIIFARFINEIQTWLFTWQQAYQNKLIVIICMITTLIFAWWYFFHIFFNYKYSNINILFRKSLKSF
jgi:hypothetical protein